MAAPDLVTWDFDQARQMGAKNSASSNIVRNVRDILKGAKEVKAIQHLALRGAAQIKDLPNNFLTDNLALHETETLKKWESEVQKCLQGEPTAGSQGQYDIDSSSSSVVCEIVAVLSRLSDLTTLEIHTFDRTTEDEEDQLRPAGDPFTKCLLRLISSSPSPPTGFGCALETVRLLVPRPEDDPDDEMDYYIYPSTLLPLSTLQRVRYIEAHRIDDGGAPMPSVVTCPTLRELYLVRCQLVEESLGVVLAAVPNLTTLHCDLVLDAERVSGWFDLGKVRGAVDSVKDSLEGLELALELWSSTAIDCGELGPWGIRGSLGCLRGFTRLTRLSVDMAMLLGWRVEGSGRLADVLPAGVRSVTITNGMFFWWGYEWDGPWEGAEPWIPRWRWIEEKILEYLESRPGGLEELILDLGVSAGEAERVAQLRNTLVSRGSDAGVKVIVHSIS